jgi:Fe-S oxidoreductase
MWLKVKIQLCDACTRKLKRIKDLHGEEAMGQAAGAVLMACVSCRSQLPGADRVSLITELKRRTA